MLYIADFPGHPDNPGVGQVYVSAGALEDGSAIRPTAHVSYEEHVRWIEAAERLPHFRGKTNVRHRAFRT
jgi:hypothetical protein